MCSLDSERDVCVAVGYIYYLHAGDNVIRYIGYTTTPIKKRLHGHWTKTNQGGTTHRDNWMRSVGMDKVEIRVIETFNNIPLSELRLREIAAIADHIDRGCDLTNATPGGEGVTMTPEIREKISASRKGWKMSEEQKAQMSEARKGVKLTPEWAKNKADAQRGKPRKITDEHRANIRKAASERELTEAQRKAIGEINSARYNSDPEKWAADRKDFDFTGRKHSAEARAKISASNRGKTISEETREKNRVGAHRQWHTNRNIIKPGCAYCSVGTIEVGQNVN